MANLSQKTIQRINFQNSVLLQSKKSIVDLDLSNSPILLPPNGKNQPYRRKEFIMGSGKKIRKMEEVDNFTEMAQFLKDTGKAIAPMEQVVESSAMGKYMREIGLTDVWRGEASFSKKTVVPTQANG